MSALPSTRSSHQPSEQTRVTTLSSEDLSDSRAEAVFDSLARAAARICQSPISLISLADLDRQCIKAAIGLDQGDEGPREHSFCSQTIESDAQIFEVPDATVDDRFCAIPLVTGGARIRHYAGATIRHEGHSIGTLCVMDPTPKVLTIPQRAALLELAHAVEQLVRERKLHRELEAQLAKAYVETPALLYLLDGTGAFTEVSDLWLEHFGYRRESVIGRNAREFMSPSARETFLIAR